MKTMVKRFLWMAVIAALCLPGCTREDGGDSMGENEKKSTAALEAKAAKEITEAAGAVKALAGEKAKEFQNDLQAKLAALDRRIDELKSATQKTAAAGNEEFKDQMQALAQQRQDLGEKLDDLGSAAAAGWEEMRSGLDAAYRDLEKAVAAAAAEFGEKESSKTTKTGPAAGKDDSQGQ